MEWSYELLRGKCGDQYMGDGWLVDTPETIYDYYITCGASDSKFDSQMHLFYLH